jgi:succinyl-CoA synthetase beta subunit
VLEGTVSGLRALGHLLATSPRPRPRAVVDAERRARWARWTAAGAADWTALLTDYGIAVARSVVVSSRAEAARAAEAIGFPVVAKTAEPSVHHKTEADGVRLGLGDAGSVGAAYEDLAARLGPRVLVQGQAEGVEVALGIVRDPLLGPLVVVAAGGTLVELIAERAVALPPVDRETARAMVGGLRTARLLDGYRGAPPADVESLVETVVALGRLAVELGDHVEAVDLNPVVVGPDGAVVVDALVLPR